MSDWRQVTSRELMRSNIEYTLDIYTVRIRLDKNINTSFQVHYKNRVYNVTSVVHDENVQSTILTVQAGVAK
jgi:Phage head-tail joining protein.